MGGEVGGEGLLRINTSVTVRETLSSSELAADSPFWVGADVNVSMCKRPRVFAAPPASKPSWWGSSRSAAGSVESATCCGRWGGGVASSMCRTTAERVEGKEEVKKKVEEEEEGGWGLEQQHDSGGRGKSRKNRLSRRERITFTTTFVTNSLKDEMIW